MSNNPAGVKSNASGGFVILLSPGFRCWQCERLLPSYPSAVLLESNFAGKVRDHIFVACSEYCAAKVREELAQAGKNPRKIDISKASVLIRGAQTKLVAVIESWRCDCHYGAMVYRGVPALERVSAFFAVRN
jgi:hypothetical protein